MDNIDERKKVLLLCASHNDLGLLRALKKMGYYIIVTGNIRGLIGEKYADKHICMDYSNKELILELAKKEKIDAICPCCNDFGVYTAAYVAEKMGFSSYDSYETTLLLNNKHRFKRFAEKYGILTPKSDCFDNIEKAKEYVKTVVFPVIIKPTDASAGNGISKVDTLEEAGKAIGYAFSKSRVGTVLIESYIEGSQHGFCTFIINQKVVAICSNNEYSIINPYRVEIDTYPAENFNEVKSFLVSQIEKIASILQLKDGIFHLQYIMANGKPYIIEVMRRVLGNMYSIPASLLNGFDWDYWEARVRCGLGSKGFPQNTFQEGYFAYKTILANENGFIENIEIPMKYEKYLLGQCFIKRVGDQITHFQSEPIGFLFFSFSSLEEMKQVLIAEYDCSIVNIGRRGEK